MPHKNLELITRFYTAFAALDHDTMADCYCADAQFEDEVFTLRGREHIASMWRMLCETTRTKGKADWSLSFNNIEANDTQGHAQWQAHYRFSATGRLVHNCINAEFKFFDGLIIAHQDHFNFWRWSKQALGMPGLLLGWSPMLRNKVRTQAAANLQAFRVRQVK